MATATDIVPLQEFLKDTSKPALEYLDGVVRRKPMPTTPHALLQFILALVLDRRGWLALAEVRVPVSSQKYLVPDLVADKEIESPYPTRPVALCIEILSPDDRLSDALAKCDLYHEWGVQHCWVVDPEREAFWQYDRGGAIEDARSSGTLRAGEINIPVEEILAEIGRRALS